ncbi:MAG: hypothetical protein QM783_13785 [Phycisphaerales bacterium]
MDAHRIKPVIICAGVVVAAIGGFAVLNRPHQAAAGQRWSTERLSEQVDVRPIHMASLTDAGVQVLATGRNCASRWAKLRMPGGTISNVYLDQEDRIDTVIGDIDPRGTWNDVILVPELP